MQQRFRIFSIILLVVAFTTLAQSVEKEYGVYEYVVKKAQGNYDQITADLQTAAAAACWKVLATVDAGKTDGCMYGARVFVLYHTAYAKEILAANRVTGPFAVLVA